MRLNKPHPALSMESRASRRLDSPGHRLKMYFDAVRQLRRIRLQSVIGRNQHRLLMVEYMNLTGAVLTEDNRIVCKRCMEHHCGCWFSDDIYKTHGKHQHYLAIEARTHASYTRGMQELELLKANLVGIEHFLNPPASNFTRWVIEHDPSWRPRRLEDDPLAFGHRFWPGG